MRHRELHWMGPWSDPAKCVLCSYSLAYMFPLIPAQQVGLTRCRMFHIARQPGNNIGITLLQGVQLSKYHAVIRKEGKQSTVLPDCHLILFLVNMFSQKATHRAKLFLNSAMQRSKVAASKLSVFTEARIYLHSLWCKV